MKIIILLLAIALLLAAVPAQAEEQNKLQSGTNIVPAECDPPSTEARIARWAIGAHVVAQVADTSTTQYAIGSGRFKEANPLLRWGVSDPVRLALIKGGFAVGASYFLLRIHRQHPRIALVTAGALAGITGWAAAHNRRAIGAIP
jgi:uncharacterized protein DUF5658